MKAAILTTTLSHAAGGPAASVPPIAHGLAKRGVQTSVLGVTDLDFPEGAKAWGPKVYAHSPLPPRVLGRASGMGKTLTEIAPDMVDVQGIWNWPSLINLRHHRATDIPYVVTPRGMLDPWARAHSAWKKHIVRLWFEDAHLRGATCLRATAEMEAEHFRSFGLQNPIAVVPNGVSVEPLPPSIPFNRCMRRMLFVSRVHPKKGLPLLIRAWAKLAEIYPNWELVVAGPDELGHTSEMQALAARLRVPRIQWLGPVRGDAKTELYRSADLFILPTYAENFGLVVAEALANGVPVITSRNAPWQGLQDNRCGWWITLDQLHLDNAMAEALALSADERAAMGERGHAWVERTFGWDGIVARMEDLYTWVAKGGTSPSFVQTCAKQSR